MVAIRSRCCRARGAGRCGRRAAPCSPCARSSSGERGWQLNGVLGVWRRRQLPRRSAGVLLGLRRRAAPRSRATAGTVSGPWSPMRLARTMRQSAHVACGASAGAWRGHHWRRAGARLTWGTQGNPRSWKARWRGPGAAGGGGCAGGSGGAGPAYPAAAAESSNSPPSVQLRPFGQPSGHPLASFSTHPSRQNTSQAVNLLLTCTQQPRTGTSSAKGSPTVSATRAAAARASRSRARRARRRPRVRPPPGRAQRRGAPALRPRPGRRVPPLPAGALTRPAARPCSRCLPHRPPPDGLATNLITYLTRIMGIDAAAAAIAVRRARICARTGRPPITHARRRAALPDPKPHAAHPVPPTLWRFRKGRRSPRHSSPTDRIHKQRPRARPPARSWCLRAPRM